MGLLDHPGPRPEAGEEGRRRGRIEGPGEGHHQGSGGGKAGPLEHLVARPLVRADRQDGGTLVHRHALGLQQAAPFLRLPPGHAQQRAVETGQRMALSLHLQDQVVSVPIDPGQGGIHRQDLVPGLFEGSLQGQGIHVLVLTPLPLEGNEQAQRRLRPVAPGRVDGGGWMVDGAHGSGLGPSEQRVKEFPRGSPGEAAVQGVSGPGPH